jgi:hypothetical protein
MMKLPIKSAWLDITSKNRETSGIEKGNTMKTVLVAFLIASLSPCVARAAETPTQLTLGVAGFTLAGVNLKSGDGLPLGALLEVSTTLHGPFGPCSFSMGLGGQSGFGQFEPNPQLRIGFGCLAMNPSDNHVGVVLSGNFAYRLRPGYGQKTLQHQTIGVLGLALVMPGGTSAVLFGTGPAKTMDEGSTIWTFSIGYGVPLAKF